MKNFGNRNYVQKQAHNVQSLQDIKIEEVGEKRQNHFKENKTRTSKVGAISKAQKAQNIFWIFFLSENVA